jgi:hypothetical protein
MDTQTKPFGFHRRVADKKAMRELQQQRQINDRLPEASSENRGSDAETVMPNIRMRTMFFVVSRIHNSVLVVATNLMGLTGSVVIEQDQVKDVFNSVEQAITGKTTYPNLVTNQLMSRNSKTGHLHLNLDKKYGSHAFLIFGPPEHEYVQLLALLNVRSAIEQIFGEIKSESLSIRTSEPCVL